jgi:hypothetical protein
MTPRHPVMLAGWFSFCDGSPTTGDEMCLAVVERWLRDADVPYVVVRAAGEQTWQELSRQSFRAQLWVCGPVTRRFDFQMDFIRRFSVAPWILVNTSLPDANIGPNGWKIELTRDSDNWARPDLSVLYPPPTTTGGGAALILRGHQFEYGEERCLCEVVEACIHRALDADGIASFDVTTVVGGDFASHLTLLERALLTADVVITTRLHGMVHAMRAGRPVVAIDQIRGGGKLRAQAAALRIPSPLAADSLDERGLRQAIRSAAAVAPHVMRDARQAAGEVHRDLLVLLDDL